MERLLCSFRPRRAAEIRTLDFRGQRLLEVPMDAFRNEATLEVLLLDDNKIAEIRKELLCCQNLFRLSLSNNTIHNLPPSIASLTALTDLNLRNNCIMELPVELQCCKYLDSLDLSSNLLEELPDELCNLTHLRNLLVNQCSLKRLPECIGKLTSLCVLELRDNNLKHIPDSLVGLAKLERLDLGENELELLPDGLSNLSSLADLCVDKNRLKRLPTNWSGRLSVSLQQMDVSSNRLEYLPAQLGNCSVLTDLDASSNRLVELSDSALPSSLQCLRIGENRLTRLHLQSAAGRCLELRELHAAKNRLDELPASLGRFRKLRLLHCDGNRLRQLPNTVGACRALSVLSARNNRLRLVPDELGRLTELRVLNLSGNRLQCLPISLLRLPDLRALWLSDNQSEPMPRLQPEEVPTQCGPVRVLTCYLLPQMPSKESDPADKLAAAVQALLGTPQKPTPPPLPPPRTRAVQFRSINSADPATVGVESVNDDKAERRPLPKDLPERRPRRLLRRTSLPDQPDVVASAAAALDPDEQDSWESSAPDSRLQQQQQQQVYCNIGVIASSREPSSGMLTVHCDQPPAIAAAASAGNPDTDSSFQWPSPLSNRSDPYEMPIRIDFSQQLDFGKSASTPSGSVAHQSTPPLPPNLGMAPIILSAAYLSDPPLLSKQSVPPFPAYPTASPLLANQSPRLTLKDNSMSSLLANQSSSSLIIDKAASRQPAVPANQSAPQTPVYFHSAKHSAGIVGRRVPHVNEPKQDTNPIKIKHPQAIAAFHSTSQYLAAAHSVMASTGVRSGNNPAPNGCFASNQSAFRPPTGRANQRPASASQPVSQASVAANQSSLNSPVYQTIASTVMPQSPVVQHPKFFANRFGGSAGILMPPPAPPPPPPPPRRSRQSHSLTYSSSSSSSSSSGSWDGNNLDGISGPTPPILGSRLLWVTLHRQQKLQRTSSHYQPEAVSLGFSVANSLSSSGVCSVRVSRVSSNGPAFGRLLPGDRLVEANGKRLSSLDHSEAARWLQCLPDPVQLLVYREAAPLAKMPTS